MMRVRSKRSASDTANGESRTKVVTRKVKSIDHYRQIHQHWQFSPEQQQMLQRYYTANQLLLDCLHSDCEVMTAARSDIKAT